MHRQSHPDQVKFRYLKGSQFRIIHADGAMGSVSPTTDIFFTLYNTRLALPDVTTQMVKPDGQLGDQTSQEKTSPEDLVRELEVGVFMNIDAASALAQWLNDKVQLARSLQERQHHLTTENVTEKENLKQ